MAGARIGYAIGEAELIESFDKIRNHFGVTLIAQAGALASLQDTAHISGVVERLRPPASASRRSPTPRTEAPQSAANFVTIDCCDAGHLPGASFPS